MTFIQRHILAIIEQFKLQQPLHLFLKSYFKENKKLGSRDRKAISEAIYSYYRLLRFVPQDTEPLSVVALALDNGVATNKYLSDTFRDWDEPMPTMDITMAKLPFMSSGISREDYLNAFAQQPYLFLRLRNGEAASKLKAEVAELSIEDAPILPNSIAQLPNTTKVDGLLEESEYVVQDRSSQLALQDALLFLKNNDRLDLKQVWDVCCGAGGKTIMIKDIEPTSKVLATDIRKSILHELRHRLNIYGMKGVNTECFDATAPNPLPQKYYENPFTLVLTDVPCSGSGTWARTPEQFALFNPKSLQEYIKIQKNILRTAATQLKPGASLVYLTCSVFEEENEAVVKEVANNVQLKLLESKLIDGTRHGSDSMYYAILSR